MKFIDKQLNIKIIECKKMTNRFLGFMFKKDIITYGLLFRNCNAIHSFFMKQPIDIIMIDKNDNIVFEKENWPPNKIIWPVKKAYSTYELPVGSIKKIRH